MNKTRTAGSEKVVSRRQALLGSFSSAFAAMTSRANATPARTHAPVVDPEWRLLNRITPGYTHAEYLAVKTQGFQSYLAQEVDHHGLPEDPDIETWFPNITWSAKQLYDDYQLTQEGSQLREATLARSVFSGQKLFERVVGIWDDHFNRNLGEDFIQSFLTHVSNRDVIRPYAMISFPVLLLQTALDPAMMNYLDNGVSTCGGSTGVPNENYAREFLELHTMGVGSTYTEQDIQELARVLAGWSLQRNPSPPPGEPEFGFFQFRNDFVCSGPKTVLSVTYHSPLSPQQEGYDFITDLGNRAETKEFIARKLIQRLLTDEAPPPSLVTAVTQAYPGISNMIQAILTPANLDLMMADSFPKYKRPMHFMTSLLRAVQVTRPADATSAQNMFRLLLTQLEKMGQRIHKFGPPTGYPDTAEDWAYGQKPRWDFAIRLMRNLIPAVTVDPVAAFAQVGNYFQPRAGLQVSAMLCGGNMTPAEVNIIQGVADNYSSSPTPDELGDLIALGAMSPTFNQV